MDFLSNINADRILVVESDPDAMDRTTDILEQAGYNVQKAYYAGDAVFAIEHGQFDLVVLDVLTKDPDHQALIERMAQLGRIRWIALVDGQSADPQRLLRHGAAACVTRPFRPATLLQQVDELLHGRKTPPPLPSPESDAPARPSDAVVSDMFKRRLAEQQTLSRLTRSLSAVLDLDVLLTQVVDAAVTLSNAEEGLLLLPDEEGQALYIRAVKGIDSETARKFRIKTQDTLAGQVFHSGKPVLVGDQGLQKVKTEYLVKSLLYVPLSIKGETIGVLGVNNKHSDRTFNPHDQDLLLDLAAHAAVAIENARLYEDSVLRTRELSTLVQAGEAANSTLAIDQVLSIIAGQLIAALDVGQCYVGEWHPDRKELSTLAVRHQALWRPAVGPILNGRGDTALEQAFRRKRMVVSSPLDPEPIASVAAAWLPYRFHARSTVHMPLLANEQPLGVAIFYRLYSPYPDPAAPQGVYLDLHQMALEMVITLSGGGAKRPAQASLPLAKRMLELAGADWCEIALWNSAQQQFDVVLSCGEGIWRDESKPVLSLEQFPQLSRILTEQTLFSGPPTGDLYDLCEIGQGKSLLAIPLVIKGRTAGIVLLVDTLHDRQFSRREVKLAQALILQAANALGNARLYRDLELSLEKLHQTQVKLVQTARLSAMGELAAAVAHQINNPLTTILGDAEMLLQDLPPSSPYSEAMEAISRAGKRAHEVVRRLLTMARRHSPDDLIEPLDVNETLLNTLMLVKGHIQQGRIALSIALGEQLPLVNGILGQLEDVWLNLLLNARDAVVNRVDPQIGVTSRYDHERDQVEVTVWDNGIGIAAEFQEQIFEPFYTTKTAGEGTGLGLHICHQVVTKCGGSIHVESTYNQGTRFIIYLPVFRE